MRIFLAIATIFFLSACSKPDPNPELKDEIYLDLNSQLGEATRTIAEEEKKLEEHNKALKEVVPQTGQIKYAQKRVFESEARLVKLRQQKQWLEVRIEERKKDTVTKYLKAFRNKEPWPNPAEFEQYKAEKKLRAASRHWDVKDRIEKFGTPPKPKASAEKPEEKKAEAAKSEEKKEE